MVFLIFENARISESLYLRVATTFGGDDYNDFSAFTAVNTIVWNNTLKDTFPAASVEVIQIENVNDGTVPTTNG